MKKYTIKYILFPLLLAAMAGCTEDPIPVAAGKLPDEQYRRNVVQPKVIDKQTCHQTIKR